MFLNTDILNEGKNTVRKSKGLNMLHSEGKSPKCCLAETKLPDLNSVKTQAWVNSNWQKLRK
jgi:hypothetical protein